MLFPCFMIILVFISSASSRKVTCGTKSELLPYPYHLQPIYVPEGNAVSKLMPQLNIISSKLHSTSTT